MRELFDEVAGQSPLDPGEAVRRASRTPQRTGPSFAVMLLAACVAIGLVGAVLALLLR